MILKTLQLSGNVKQYIVTPSYKDSCSDD